MVDSISLASINLFLSVVRSKAASAQQLFIWYANPECVICVSSAAKRVRRNARRVTH